MTLRIVHESYNPSAVLANAENRDEYDFLFSSKCKSDDSTLNAVSKSLCEIATGISELFVSDFNADPAKLGETQRLGAQYAAGFQALLGVSKMVSGDLYSGVYNSMLGILGVSCSREGKNKEMLKTYVVISFINGCVQVMEVAQAFLSGFPIFGHGLPILLKVGQITSVLNPCASFTGAYLGWQYIKAAKRQYMLALAHYQLQMLMMHQQQQMVHGGQTSLTEASHGNSKRLPAIAEESGEGELCEATGGSENTR